MTLRFLAALTLILGVAALLGYLNVMGKGPLATPALRHLRTMKDRRTAPDSVSEMHVADFGTLPRGSSLASYVPLEQRGVSLEGYVQRVLRALDDDVHLEVVADPPAEGGHDSAYASAEITPGWRLGSSRWTYERLAAAFRVNHGTLTPWEGGPRRVRLSGWLLYDFQYDWRPSLQALHQGAPRVSGWEIHPVTRIEIWDDDARRYVDYPR